MDGVEFRILGPLEVSVGGRLVRLGGRRPRTTLAALLLAEGRVVPVERLVDLVWGEEPPASVRGQVAIAVSALRKAFREAGSDEEIIETVGAGYRAHAVHLDATKADRLIAGARAAAEEGRRVEAVSAMREALALWRGPVLADLGPLTGASRWEELRLSTTEECVELCLALGRHGELIAELTDLLAEHPLRERPRAQLMLALYRAGRRGEALEVLRAGRKLLAEELGLEPGQELRDMERAVLAADPVLDLVPPQHASGRGPVLGQAAGRGTAGGGRADSVGGGTHNSVGGEQKAGGGEQRAVGGGHRAVGGLGPAELPAAVTGFIGRQGELDRVHRLGTSGEVPIVAITGPGGIGKSALAVRAARRIAAEFPDGQLYVDLRGSTPGLAPLRPEQVLGRFLRSLGVPNAEIPADPDEASARFRSLAARQRLLVVLDNATSVGQVRPLLPSGPGCLVIVTARRAFTTLDGAAHLQLAAMEPDEAVALLARAIGDDRVAVEKEAAAEIAVLCGGLPLAVRIVAARAAAHPRWSLDDLRGSLVQARTRLDSLEYADLAVRTSFAVSLQRLREEPGCAASVRLFGLLGLLDVHTVTPGIAAALMDDDDQAAGAALDGLEAARLIEQTTIGRYGMHDLLRLYARELAAPDGNQVGRAAHRYLATVLNCRQLLVPGPTPLMDGFAVHDEGLAFADRGTAIAWLDDESDNLIAVIQQLLAVPEHYDLAARMCVALGLPLFARGRTHDMRAVSRQLLETAEKAGDLVVQANAHNNLGIAGQGLAQAEVGAYHFERAAALWKELGQPDREAKAINNLAIPYRWLGRLEEALDCNRRAVAIFQELGDRQSEAAGWDNLGLTCRRLGRFDECVPALELSLTIRRELGLEREVAMSLCNLAETHHLRGEHARAVERFEQALELAVSTGERHGEAICQWGLGQARHAMGQPGLPHWHASIALLRDMALIPEDEAERLLSQPVPDTPSAIR